MRLTCSRLLFLGPVFQQHFGEFGMAILSRDCQRCPSPFGFDVNLRPCSQERLGNFPAIRHDILDYCVRELVRLWRANNIST